MILLLLADFSVDRAPRFNYNRNLLGRAPAPASGKRTCPHCIKSILACQSFLRPSYLYRGCTTYLLVGKHLSGVSGFIKLKDPTGKQWPVRYLCKGGGARLGWGLYDFSLENNLEEGDVCVFQLINMNVYDAATLEVTVF